MNVYASWSESTTHWIPCHYGEGEIARQRTQVVLAYGRWLRKPNIAGFSEQIYRLKQDPAPLSSLVSYIEVEPAENSTRLFSTPEAQLNRIVVIIQQQLGQHAADRLRSFASYPDGWDEGQGRALNRGALAGLERILQIADFSQSDVALFMSHDGHPILNWPDHQGELVEVEIGAHTLDCYVAAEGSEFALPITVDAVRDFLTRYH